MRVGELVRRYIDRRWHIKRCLQEGLINRSALARKISDESKASFQSVLMALRRISFENDILDEKIKKILKNSRLNVRTGMGIVIGSEHLGEVLDIMTKAYERGEEFHLLKQANVWVVIAPMTYINELEKYGFRVHKDVVELVIKSPPEIEETPGVLSEILNRFRSAGINIIEFLSCWSDTILVVDKNSMHKAITIIEELIS